MDSVLEQTLKLACLIRDSEEANAWRSAWNLLRDIPVRSVGPPSEETPIAELLHHIRMSEQGQPRPLLFPLLVAHSLPGLKGEQIQEGLKDQPETWHTYQQLVGCFTLIGLIISFLRNIGSGHPHKDLAYTVPNTPWTQLSSEQELPWWSGSNFGIAEEVTDAKSIDLERRIPSISTQVVVCLNNLVAEIRADDIWLELAKSYEKISKRDNLKKKMHRARVRFERELNESRHLNIPKIEWQAKVEKLARTLYAKEGAQVMGHIHNFRQYERLIERIYWLLSQIIIYEAVSSITSAVPQQVQQVSLSPGRMGMLTAVAPTFTKTLEIGQIVHIELPETEHLLDGLYQVGRWIQKYQVASGARIFFSARSLWYCQLTDLHHATEQSAKRTFVPSEEGDILEGGIDIVGPEGKVATLRFDELIGFNLSHTMYLP
jgi:hypothetical protein